jgi:hypothetical protein
MHSPEPWKLHQRSKRPGDVDVADANDQCVLETDWIPGELERADYERIVACVNALAGVQDPTAFMQSVHALIWGVKSSRLLTTPSLQARCDEVLEHRQMEIPS